MHGILVIDMIRNSVSTLTGSLSPTARGPGRALVDDAVAVGRDRGHVRDPTGVHRILQHLVDGRPVDGCAHA